jgi:hypothetical protein
MNFDKILFDEYSSTPYKDNMVIFGLCIKGYVSLIICLTRNRIQLHNLSVQMSPGMLILW